MNRLLPSLCSLRHTQRLRAIHSSSHGFNINTTAPSHHHHHIVTSHNSTQQRNASIDNQQGNMKLEFDDFPEVGPIPVRDPERYPRKEVQNLLLNPPAAKLLLEKHEKGELSLRLMKLYQRYKPKPKKRQKGKSTQARRK